MELDKTTYTVFDVETTGLYPYSGDKICEIGAVRIEPNGAQKTFQALVNPCREVSPGAFKVNQITSEMVKDKPLIEDVMPDFLDFMQNTTLVAYNAGFDLGFIEMALGYKKYIMNDFKVIDALKLARQYMPGMDKYNLAYVAESLGISTQGKHRALADAVMTAGVFLKQTEILRERGVRNVEDIMEFPKTREKDSAIQGNVVLEHLEKAISGKTPVDITYRSVWNNKTTKRTITPKRIKQGYDKLYVIAYCHMRGEDRNFRLDCITSVRAVPVATA